MGAGQYHEGHVKTPVEKVMIRPQLPCSCSSLDAHGGPEHSPHSADVTGQFLESLACPQGFGAHVHAAGRPGRLFLVAADGSPCVPLSGAQACVQPDSE